MPSSSGPNDCVGSEVENGGKTEALIKKRWTGMEMEAMLQKLEIESMFRRMKNDLVEMKSAVIMKGEAQKLEMDAMLHGMKNELIVEIKSSMIKKSEVQKLEMEAMTSLILHSMKNNELMVGMTKEVKEVKSAMIKKGEVQKLEMEVMLQRLKTDFMVEVKDGMGGMLQCMKSELMAGVKEDIMELKSAVNTEMMVLKAEVAKSGPTVSLPECPICMQDMAPPTRIIQCQMGHKVCEPCHDAAMGRGRRDCPGHCGTSFIGRDLGMEAFMRQITGRQ